MKNKYTRIFFVSALAVLSALYFYKDLNSPKIQKTDNVDIQISDNKDSIIANFNSPFLGNIILKNGNEKFGLVHILMRHSSDFYVDYHNKGSLFPAGTDINEIINAIETVIKSGQIDPKAKGNSKALKKELYLHDQKANYRLIISEDSEIITFFKAD